MSAVEVIEPVAAQAGESSTQDPPRARPCAHCGLPAPIAHGDATEPVFCCHGCRGAYELIHGWGLDTYYALRDQSAGASTGPVQREGSRYDAFEDPQFLGRSTPVPQEGGLVSAEFALHGLHCAACVWLIENAAARTPGWRMARVKMSDHTVKLAFDPAQTRLGQIARLLGTLGYELLPLTGHRDDQFRRENRRMLSQIAVAGFFAANAMWIAVALYAGEASGVEHGHREFLRWMGTALGVAAVVVPGRTFFVGAVAALRMRTPHMDMPVALGLMVGTSVGALNAATGRGDVYFDSLAVLVFLLLIGRWIQFRQQHRAARAVDLLLRITPQHARRLDVSGAESWVLVDSLRPGETIRVAAGESIPADGCVVRGESVLDRSLLTGESRPVAVGVGDAVAAGTVNRSRSIEVRVEATGRASRIGKIMDSVEAAMTERVPVVQMADRVGGVFVVVVTMLAGLTLVGWASHGWEAAAAHATALLIVACPCALALATPLAISVALGRAASGKLLIRDGGALQRLASPGTLWFDKTGTLTEGRLRARILSGAPEAVAHAAAVEAGIQHPVAEAIRRLAEEMANESGVQSESQASKPTADEGRPAGEVLVGGVVGTSGGQHVLVGTLRLMEDHQVRIAPALRHATEEALRSGVSPVVVALDGVATTVLVVSDVLRPQAAQTVARLRRRGWRIGILSGDHPSVVQRVAAEVGIAETDAHGGLSPEDKLAIVRQRRHAGRGEVTAVGGGGDLVDIAAPGESIVMVGDGANDAAALAAADVGVAVRGGAEVSLQAAPVFIASGDIAGVEALIDGSERTGRLILAAFAVSLSYNVGAVALAMAGRISPLAAAVLMPLSSVSVLSLTLLWPTFRTSGQWETREP